MEPLVQDLNIKLTNPETRTFLADAIFTESANLLPLVVFVHGYKGFKDWGAWQLLAEAIAEAGCFFVKFNFSYNGTSLNHPKEFDDLEGFGQDNFTKQLSDLQYVLDYFTEKYPVQKDHITLLGHSRGGGVAVIKASEDIRIKRLITLAGVDHLDFFPKGQKLEKWKETGVLHTVNGRTKQSMPHYFQLYEDFQKNSSRLNVGNHARSYRGKTLILHGSHDEAVPLSAAEHLHQWCKNSELKIIPNAGHTFGAHEPWLHQQMPKYLQQATEEILNFLQSEP